MRAGDAPRKRGTDEGEKVMPIIQRTVLATLAVSLMLASPSAAQDRSAAAALAAGQAEAVAADPDARWLPWFGCWQLWEEQVERAASGDSAFPERTVVCMTPTTTAAGAGAHLTARGNDAVLVERTLVADGTRRDIADGECSGWEQRTWSRDGFRLYTNAELRCGDETPVRRTSGISLMSGRATWVDLQLVTFGERQHLEIRRYTPAAGGADMAADALPASRDEIRRARARAGASPTLRGIRDAALAVDTRVVEAMLTETEPRLDLDAAALIELDAAGIDGGVIDLLVALAYPERFTVQRRSRGSRGGSGWSTWGGAGSGLGWGGAYDPIWYSDLYPYYLTPLGYGMWGRGYNPYFYNYGSNPFISIRDAASAGAAEAAPRAVNRLGYTQVSERTGVGRGAAVPVGSGASGRGVSTRSGGSSAGGRGTSGGYTRGGSGGGGGGGGGGRSGGGRTAVPRR